MKRITIVLFLILSLVICLPSCRDDQKSSESTTTTTSATTKAPDVTLENPDFAKFNTMFGASFENYTITISSTAANGSSVNKEYVVSSVNGERSVSYTIETLNDFIIDGDTISIPDEYKTVTKGIYDATESASTAFEVPKFKFSNTCINSEVITPVSFKANITSIEQFMGLNIVATDAQFSLSYLGENVESIQISYVTESENTVVITYTFN